MNKAESTYLALTLDPLHIGAGGYRLGRVDNTIVRDAGSGLPKVPGSSLAGVTRYYASISLNEGQTCCRDILAAQAEQDGSGSKKKDESYCGHCTICDLFGYAADKKESKSHIGLLHFYDGIILAFPVRTMAGPVWVTCPSVLASQGYSAPQPSSDNELIINFDLPASATSKENRLNLGWLYLPARKTQDEEQFPQLPLGKAASLLHRIAIAPDWLFSEIVNSNLEVRTSVSIDPKTGAAKTGALFTYEAIPAATLLAFNIAIDTHRLGKYQEDEVRALLDRALSCCEVLGMGGMNTRGFGRLRFLNLN